MRAAWRGHTTSVRALLDHHADPDIVRALLQRGANAGLKNSDGATALSLARAQGHKQMVELLAAKQKHNKFNKHKKRRTGAC